MVSNYYYDSGEYYFDPHCYCDTCMGNPPPDADAPEEEQANDRRS